MWYRFCGVSLYGQGFCGGVATYLTNMIGRIVRGGLSGDNVYTCVTFAIRLRDAVAVILIGFVFLIRLTT